MTRGMRLFVAVIAALALTAPAFAAGPGTPVVISANQSGGTLTVQGSGFGSAPNVALGGVILGNVVVNSIGTTLTASAPSLVPGTYELTVSNGSNKSVAFDMTLGVQG